MNGLCALRDAIFDMATAGQIVSGEGALITNIRHLDALRRTSKHLSRSVRTLRKGFSEEFVAADMRDALSALGEIVGETVAEDILDRIFSQFCIGK
jgi:tRNA modification GTPase